MANDQTFDWLFGKAPLDEKFDEAIAELSRPIQIDEYDEWKDLFIPLTNR